MNPQLNPLPGDHVFGVWFVSLCGKDGTIGDWLMTAWRRGDALMGAFRFRWYEDARVWGSSDRKQWGSVEGKPGDEDAFVASCHGAYETVGRCTVGDAEKAYVEVNGSVEDMLEKLHAQPWCHIEKITEQ